MTPFIHSKIHSKKYGGKPEDYIAIDNLIDSSKSHHASVKHRAVLHSSFGIFIAEQVFGFTFVNSDGKTVGVRDIVQDHIRQDLGFIPSVDRYLNNMTVQPWMPGTEKRNKEKKPKFIAI